MRYTLIICLFNYSIIQSQNLSAQNARGLVFDDDAYEQTLINAPLTRSLAGEKLPAAVSLKQYTPTPKNQGNYGTCVAWSSTYAGYTTAAAIQNNWTQKTVIDDNAFSPEFVYALAKKDGDNNCQKGTQLGDVLEILKTKGAVRFKEFQTQCAGEIPQPLLNKASTNKIKAYTRIFSLDDPNKVGRTKKSISEKKPVVMGMKCPESFDIAKNVWIPTASEKSNINSHYGHAMCVVGYDDNMQGGAFEIMNSWGTDWGNGGYIWVRYVDYEIFARYAFELFDAQPKKSTTSNVALSGKVRFELADGSEMQASLKTNKYLMTKSYKSGTAFRYYLSNNEPAFVYAFASDLTGKTFLIFPHRPDISPALTYKRNEVAIPPENEPYIKMDFTVGTDYLCVLYSNEPLNINEIQVAVEKASGSFEQKVKNVLAGKMVDFGNVQFGNQEISFQVTTNDKPVVVIIVEIPHI